MSISKKLLVVVILAMVFMITISGLAAGLPDTLYQSTSRQTISAGVTLEHVSRFTTEGWLNIKVLKIDTKNPNVRIDTLSNNRITDKLLTIPSLAENKGAIAAINAGFFNSLGGGRAYPDGPLVMDGELITTPGWYNKSKDELASLSLTDSNQILFHYWKNDLTLRGPDKLEFVVSQYNQPSRKNYQDITVWDNKWAEFTLGASETYPDLVEIVVAQGRIKEIRQAEPAVEIPVNGFVVISRGEQAAKLLECLEVRDELEFRISSIPNWEDLKMSASGASILVKDGQPLKNFSYGTSSFNRKNPRTLAGSSKDGRELILVTVDGRQDNSIGLTQSESAELMLELGAYNALIFDGGGSTTMVARKPGTTVLEVVNIPSEGALRTITHGIGVFSRFSPESSSLALTKLILETEDPNVFVRTSREFSLLGVDRNYNPVKLDLDQVQWEVKGIEGIFKNNIFYPSSTGKGKVIARIGEITAEIEINSLEAPVKLALNPGLFKVQKGEEQSLLVTGYDEEGFSALIHPDDVSWKVMGQIGELEGTNFKATAVGTGYIEASVGDVRAYSAVSVFTEEEHVINNFENERQDSQQISNEQVYKGNGAGKLIYDFYVPEVSAKAFLPFQEEGLFLKENATHLAIWVYNETKNNNTIGAEILDASGHKHDLKFTSHMDWTGWKQLKAPLEEIENPVGISAIYVQNNDPNTTWGQIFLDDLTAVTSRHPEIDPTQIPQNTLSPDKANRKVDFTPNEDSFRFSVIANCSDTGGSSAHGLQNSITNLTNYLNKNIDMAVCVGDKAAEAFPDLKKPLLATEKIFDTHSFKNSSFIRLDVSEGGLRRSNPQQWTWLFGELNSLKGSNVFIAMAGDPAGFANAKEAQLLKDILAEYRNSSGKNIWVFYPGDSNRSELDRGVRYISTTGFHKKKSSPGQPDTVEYLEVTVRGTDLTFDFKSFP